MNNGRCRYVCVNEWSGVGAKKDAKDAEGRLSYSPGRYRTFDFHFDCLCVSDRRILSCLPSIVTQSVGSDNTLYYLLGSET
jgi:hypothetical protein